MRVPSGRSGQTNPDPAAAIGAVVNRVSPASGVRAASTRQQSRPRGASEPRGGKTGTAGGGAAGGRPISSAPPGSGPAGLPPPLTSRSFGGAITQAQLQASLSPVQGQYFSVTSGPNRRRRSY